MTICPHHAHLMLTGKKYTLCCRWFLNKFLASSPPPNLLTLYWRWHWNFIISFSLQSLHSSEDYTHPKTIVAHVDAFEQDRRPKRRRCREELRILQENSPHIPLPERIKMHTRKKRFEIVDEQSAIHKRLCKAASKFFKSIFNLKKRKGRNNTTYIPKEQIDPIVESQGRYQYYLMKSA